MPDDEAKDRPQGQEKPAGERRGDRAAHMAKEAAREATEAAKAASKDALQAVKLLVSDPVGKLPDAYEKLGENRAMAAGVVFGVVFDLCVLVGGYLLLRGAVAAMSSVFGGDLGAPSGFSGPRIGFGGIVRLLIIGAVPVASLALGGLVSRKVFQGEGSFKQDLFVAGAALLPMAALLLIMGVFVKVPLIIVAALPFAVSFSVLMLYAACTEMNRISKRAASFAVPLMLLVAGGIAFIVTRIL